MSDDIDEGKVGVEPEKSDGAAYLYDYFKHLTSLSILTLGGVLAISQREGAAPGQAQMYAVVILVALAGVLAFSGSGAIVRQQSTGKTPGKWFNPNFYRIASPASLSLGVGMFLALYLKGVAS
ncbi:MAG: hypothetical protein J0H88_09120 [Sphingomonadales bacterium]|nr:hypothetical protein [Sphingomonadales bacterium]